MVAEVFAVWRAWLAAKWCSAKMAWAFSFAGAFLGVFCSVRADESAHQMSKTDQHVDDWRNIGRSKVQRELSDL
jgi:hypothetical protein